MPMFTVKWDFRKAQPRWGGDLARTFGPNNEGVKVETDDAEAARRKVADDNKLNVFYLKAE